MKIYGNLEGETLVLSNQVPIVSGKAILLNVNVQPNKLRVYGWGEPV
jgi:hypothetical protein